MLFVIFLYLLLYYVAYELFKYFNPSGNIDPQGHYVLITGCDSGFGHALAIELDRQGFNVFAGVLSSNSIDELRRHTSHRTTIMPLDITKQADIDAAYDLVVSKTAVLHALVNNAGIGMGGYIDWISMDLMRRIMEVNFYGQVMMTKKFLPLLIAKRDSRVVNVCSVMGFITPPGMSAYCASKYAFESFSDCLRREMAPWGLRVSIIEPGWLRTPIIRGHARLLRDLWSEVSPEVKNRWGDAFFNELIQKSVVDSPFIKNAEDPIKVVRALQHAVMNTEPQLRYRPDLQGKFIFFPLSQLPAWLTDSIIDRLSATSIAPAGTIRAHSH